MPRSILDEWNNLFFMWASRTQWLGSMGSQQSSNLSSGSVANAISTNRATSSSISTSVLRLEPLPSSEARNQAALTTTTSGASVASHPSSSSYSSAPTIFNDGLLYQDGVALRAFAEPESRSRYSGLSQDVTLRGSLATSVQSEVFRQTRTLQRLAGITYEQFLGYIKELNQISSHFLDSNGKQLVFAVKKGSDSTLLWKATVRVACVKIDVDSKDIESHQVFTSPHLCWEFN